MTASEALAALVEALRAHPRGGEHVALASALDSSLPRAGSPASAALVEGVRALALRLVVAVTDGGIPIDSLALVARLRDVVMPVRARTHVIELPPPPVVESVLLAARGLPRPRALVREPYVGTAVAAAELGDLGEAEQANDVEDDEESRRRATVALDAMPLDPSELPSPPRPPVTLRAELPPPIFVDAFHQQVVSDALEGMRAFSRDRWVIFAADRSYAEDRILKAIDAIAVTPGNPVERVLRAWRSALELPGSWQSFAAGMALGAFVGGDVALATLDAVEALPPASVEHALMMADGFATVGHEGTAALTNDLLTSRAPCARAAGVRLAVRRGAQDIETLRSWLLDPDLIVVREGLRGLEALAAKEANHLLPLVSRWLNAASPALAWPAARALLVAGSLEPLRRVRERGAVATALGLDALEVLVLAGEAEDASHFAWVAARFPSSAALLNAIARFGHLGAFSRLAHALADDDLGDAAASALEVLLGEMVGSDRRRSAGAWRSALRDANLTSTLRHRRGQPWSPRVIAEECADLSCREIQDRLCEVRVRTGKMTRVDLESFWPSAGVSLETALSAIRREGAQYPAGSYRVV